MNVKVILNPYAGRWAAQKRIPEVRAALDQAGVNYQLVLTEKPGHAIALAEQAVEEGVDTIIAAGGDGTISEVVNGMCNAARVGDGGEIKTRLGIFPLGSANDFVVCLGLPRDVRSAAAAIHSTNVKRVDLGVVTHHSSEPKRTYYFDNNSAVGLEPTITLIQEKITFLHGAVRYLTAALVGVMKNPKWTVELEWEGGSYRGPATLVTVGNNPLTGGIFYMTPHADPADGRLTFVYGYMRTRLEILRLLPRTMKAGQGSYVEHPNIHEEHSTWLRVHCEPGTPLHGDGEIQTRDTQDVEYRILPGRLPVIIP